MSTLKAKLLDWKELSPEVHHFRFEVPGVEALEFTPGQFVCVVEQRDGKTEKRAYSIASPRSGNRFELCLNRVPSGAVSSLMFNLKPGDEVDIRQPLGHFTLRHPARRALFLATGTGIAPFRSMLLDHLPRSQPRIVLLFGVRHESSLLYRDEFEALANEYPSFDFLPTVTQPGPAWKGRTGRIQQHLDEALELLAGGETEGVDVYICGLREMVEHVRKQLLERGFERKQIISERYD